MACTHISRPQEGQSREPGSLATPSQPGSLLPPSPVPYAFAFVGGLYFSQEMLPHEGPEEHSLHLQPQASCPISTDCPLSNFALPRAARMVSPDPENNSSSAWSPRRPRSLPLTPHLPTDASSHAPLACLHMPGPSSCMLFYTCPGSSPSPTQPALSDKTVFASLQ